MQPVKKNPYGVNAHEMSTYIPDYSLEGNDFLENIYPGRVKLLRSILKTCLPDMLWQQFIAWQNNDLQMAFFKDLQAVTGKKIEVFARPVANFAPKYTEFKLFFDINQDDDKVHKNVYGFGQSFSSSGEALTKAIGEFLERYFLSVDWAGEVRISTKKKLGRSAVTLKNMPGYLESQKKVEKNFVTRKNAETTEIGWIKAEPLLGFFKKYVPSERVFWMPPGSSDNLGILNHSTSNGNAAHFTKQKAELASLYELIERDGFMYYWLCKIAPYQIDVTTIRSPGLVRQRKFLERYKLEVSFFDITTALNVPAVMCIVVDMSVTDDPKISVGASAGFSLDKLIDGSFMEALVVQRHHAANQSKDVTFSKENYFFDKLFDGEDLNNRIYFWRGTKAVECLQFLYCGKKITYDDFYQNNFGQEFRSDRAEYSFVKKAFTRLVKKFGDSYKPYIYAVEHPYLRKIGYRVNCAVVMGLYPLYMVEYKVNLDIKNMAHWEETSNNKKLTWDGVVKNTHPHPFP